MKTHTPTSDPSPYQLNAAQLEKFQEIGKNFITLFECLGKFDSGLIYTFLKRIEDHIPTDTFMLQLSKISDRKLVDSLWVLYQLTHGPICLSVKFITAIQKLGATDTKDAKEAPKTPEEANEEQKRIRENIQIVILAQIRIYIRQFISDEIKRLTSDVDIKIRHESYLSEEKDPTQCPIVQEWRRGTFHSEKTEILDIDTFQKRALTSLIRQPGFYSANHELFPTILHPLQTKDSLIFFVSPLICPASPEELVRIGDAISEARKVTNQEAHVASKQTQQPQSIYTLAPGHLKNLTDLGKIAEEFTILSSYEDGSIKQICVHAKHLFDKEHGKERRTHLGLMSLKYTKITGDLTQEQKTYLAYYSKGNITHHTHPERPTELIATFPISKKDRYQEICDKLNNWNEGTQAEWINLNKAVTTKHQGNHKAPELKDTENTLWENYMATLPKNWNQKKAMTIVNSIKRHSFPLADAHLSAEAQEKIRAQHTSK